ncbi:MAG: aspartate aminotransferase family protein [Pirellulaceae bacterium]
MRTDAELNMGGSWPAPLADSLRIVTTADDKPETIIRLAPEADLIYTCYAPINAEVIASATRLRGIVKYGVGTDSIDLEAATACGIPVVHCPDYGTDTVADHAFALLIGVARKLTTIDRGMQAHGWLWPEPAYRGVDLANKTLGLIGFGRIGKAMAKRGGGFGMRRLVCDPYVPHDTDGWGDLAFVPREQVLEEADFLSMHCVLTPETRHIVDAAGLRRMKPGAIVVNVSRGALIEQSALIDALREGRIAGAGLDVFPREPLEKSEPLHALENVILTPHLAFYTQEAYQRLEDQCGRAVRELLAGKLPPNVKNGDALRQQGTLDPCWEAGPTTSGNAEKDSASQAARVSTLDACEEAGSAGQADAAWQAVEGDVNLTPQRTQWQDEHTDEATRDLLARDGKAFLHQSLSTPCLTALAACEGIDLIDEQGRRYMDFHGNSAHQVGYGHPRVLEALRAQLEVLPFCPRRFTNRPAIELAEKLGSLAPGNLQKVLFAPGGTSAIGIAMKLARYATGRHKTISMWDSFHGASLDAISIGGERLFRDRLGPLLPGCFHVPWPRTVEDAGQIEQILVQQGDIGAIIAEPMRCTTLERPADAYWQEVRRLCDQHGVLLVFDEIPTALGRTGRMFCCEHAQVVPDMLIIGKGLGGGVMPMAAAIVRAELDLVADRALGHYTHEKSPLGAAAALATIGVIESDQLLERAVELGHHAMERLRQLQHQQALVADVRGLGLALAIELAGDLPAAAETAQRILYRCLSAGLSFKVSSGNVLTLTPPLTISPDQLGQSLDIVQEAIELEAQ